MKPVFRVGFVLIILIMSFLFIFTSCSNGAEEVTVVFYVDDEVYKTITTTAGSSVTPPEVPEKYGYIGKWDIKVFSNILEDMIINAVYTPRNFSIIFKAEDADGVLRVVEARTAPYEGELKNIPQVPQKEGFTGVWNITDFSYINSDMEVTAVYTRNSYTIDFHTNGGEELESVLAEYGSEFNYTIQRDGYIFLGWFLDEECTIPFDLDYVPARNLTLYAGWSQITYTVYLETQDQSLNSIITRAYGISIDNLPILSRHGYKFNGWYLDQSFTLPVELPLYPEEDMTIYADWIVDNTNMATDFIYFSFNPQTGMIKANPEKTMPENIILPSIFDNQVVKGIDDYGFMSSGIKSVRLPESITRIGDFAFSTESLEIINFDSGSRLRTIGNGAFMNCAISEIILPENLEVIGHRAFYNCQDLKDIFYLNADNLLRIGAEAYENTQWYNFLTDGIDGSVVYIGKVLYSAVGNLATDINIRQDIVSISPQAFQNQQYLNSLNIPDTVKYIGGEFNQYGFDIKGAFYNCKNLSFLNFNQTSELLSISAGAFAGCEKIQSIASSSDMALCQLFSTEDMDQSYQVEYDGNIYYVPNSLKQIIVFSNGHKKILPYAFSNLLADTIILIEGIEEIGDYAFYNSGHIAQITIPDSVVKIGQYAFKDCVSLEQIVLQEQNNLKEIGEGAFYGLNTTDLHFPNTDKLESVGSFAFYNCQRLYELIAPNITSIGEGAFALCAYLEKIYIPNNLTSVLSLFSDEVASSVDFYSNSGYYIPLSLKEITLTLGGDDLSLADEYLMGFSSIQTINLPLGLESIGRYALSGTGIVTIDIPDSVQTIDEYGLSSNSKLRTVSISPDSVLEAINANVFNGCILLEELFVPKTVQSFDLTAITDCNNLKNIFVDKENEIYFDDNGVLYCQDTLLHYPKDRTYSSYTVIEGTKYIVPGAFTDTMLLDIVLPESLLDAQGAFTNKEFRAVVMCALVTIDNIFDDSVTIEELTIKGQYILDEFASNLVTPKVIIESGVIEIGKKAFYQSGIEEIFIPASIQTIKAQAFAECESLIDIVFEDQYTLVEVGMEAFHGTSWYQNQIDNQVIYIGNIAYGYVGDMPDEAELIIREGVTTIADHAFRDLSAVHSITLPSTLETIGKYAFANLENLSHISFNESLVTIGEGAFINNTSLENVEFSNSVEYIGDYAFNGAVLLDSIILPNNLKHIGKEAFYNNQSLNSILIPQGVEYIGDKAFYGCINLESISFDDFDALSDMGREVFDNTKWYNSMPNGEVFIPATNIIYKYKGEAVSSYFLDSKITRILPYAFSNQNSLTTLRLNQNLERIENFAFENCQNLISVTNVSDDMALYHIGKGAFADCTSLEEFTIPIALSVFDLSVFENCSSLSIVMVGDNENHPYFRADGGIIYNTDYTEIVFAPMGLVGNITIRPTVTHIPDFAFKDRKFISSIEIPNGIQTIGIGAFENAENLQSVTFEPNSFLSSIGERAFYNTAITSLTIPRRANFIGKDAFSYDLGLDIVLTSDSPPQIEGDISHNSKFFVPRNRLELYLNEIDFENIYPSKVRVSFMTGSSVFIYYEVTYGQSLSTHPAKPPQKTGYEGYWLADELALVWDSASEEYLALFEDVTINAVYTKKTYIITFTADGVSSTMTYKYDDILDITDAVSDECHMFLFWTHDLDTLVEFTLERMPAHDIELFAVWYRFEYEFDSENNAYSVKPQENPITPETVIIPNEYNEYPITKIAEGAFENDYSITNIAISDNIEVIGNRAFANSSLINLITSENSALKSIGENAFSGSQITSFVFENMLSIAEKAFYDAKKLVEARINIDFSESGNYLFQNASALRFVSIQTSQISALPEGMFMDCHALKDVILSPQIQFIEKDSYLNAYSLEQIDLSNITHIGESAFENCQSIIEVCLESAEYIGQRAFYNAKNLKNVYFGENETLDTIDEYAFYGTENLTYLIVPATTKHILDNALIESGVRYLFVMESANPYHGSMSLYISSEAISPSVTIFVGEQLDYNQSRWQDNTVLLYRDIINNFVVDSENVIIKYIGDRSIVQMPDRIGTDWTMGIAYDVFENNLTIEQISLSEILLQYIEDGRVFSYAETLEYIDSPQSVNGVLYNQDGTSLLAYPLNKASLIYEVNSAVQELADFAFYGTKNLNSLIVKNQTPPRIYENTFAYVNSKFKIYVPSNALSAYKNADIWKDHADIIFPEEIKYNDLIFIEHQEGLELSQYLGNDDYVEIPLSVNGKNVVSIGSYAFYNTTIKSVKMPSGIKYIGNYAFSKSALERITLHNAVRVLGKGAFEGCLSLTDITFGSSILINEIKENTFKDTAFQTINIPRSITAIGNGAFANNLSLHTVILPIGSKLMSIGDFAFYNNQSLNYLNLSQANNINSIGESAFAYCASLTSIYIPQNLTVLGSYAFAYCENMTSLSFMGSGSLKAFPDHVLYGSTKVDRLTIPASVTTIGERAFYNNAFEKVTFESGSRLSVIGEYAFANSQKIQSVHLYDAVTEIKEGAFANCTELRWLIVESILPPTLHNSVTKVWEDNLRIYVPQSSLNLYKNQWTTYSEGINSYNMIFGQGEDVYSIINVQGGVEIFQYMGSHSQITVPEQINGLDVVSIGSFAFGKEAEEITLPNTVTNIKSSAFYRTRIQSFEIGKNITDIQDNPFVNNYYLETLTVEEGNTVFKVVENVLFDIDMTRLIAFANAYSPNHVYQIPETVDWVGNDAFRGAIDLLSVTISESVTCIGDWAFYDCLSLTEVIFINPKMLEYVGQTAFDNTLWLENQADGEIYISSDLNGELIFYTYKGDMPLDTEITLNEDTISILPYALFNQSNLTALHIPYGVEKIGENALNGCSGLNELTLPGEYILGELFGETAYNGGYSSFNYKTQKTYYIPQSLQKVNISAMSTEIVSHAFYNAKSVTDVLISDSVEHIGRLAFYSPEGDMSLTNIVFENPAFSALETIGSYAFMGNRHITELTLPSNLINITAHAFEGLESLETLVFMANGDSALEYIGVRAFAECVSLKELNLPDELKRIGAEAFINCLAIRDINLPYQSELYEIGERAFKNNRTLRQFITNSNLAIIQDEAFYGCMSLTDFDDTYSKESLIYLGSDVFEGTPYYTSLRENNPNTLIYLGRVAYEYNGFLADRTLIVLEQNTYSLSPNLFRDPSHKIHKITTIRPQQITQTVVVLNMTLKIIGRHAFANNPNLTEAILPLDLEYIGDFAFEGCTALANIEFDNDENLKYIGHNAFEDTLWYQSLFQAHENNSVVYIGNVAYAYKGQGEEYFDIRLDENTVSVSPFAFDNQDKLLTFYMPSSILNISQFAFGRDFESGEKALTTIYLEEGGENIAGIFSLASKVILNSMPVKLKGSAVYSYIENIDGENVRVYDFMDVIELIELLVSEDIMPHIYVPIEYLPYYYYAEGWEDIFEYIVPYDTIQDDFVVKFNDGEAEIIYYKGNSLAVNVPSFINGIPVVSIAPHAFNASVQKVFIGENIRTIQDYTFYRNINLTQVVMPESLLSIGNYTFAECKALEYIEMPENLVEIGEYAFYNCVNLKDIALNEGLESVGEYAFAKCLSLIHITMPSTVAYMGNYIFNDCALLNIIVMKGEPPMLGQSGLYYQPLTNIHIFVPQDALESYRTHSRWTKYSYRTSAVGDIADLLFEQGSYDSGEQIQLNMMPGGLFEVYIAPQGISDRTLLHTDYEQGEEYYQKVTKLEGERTNRIIELPLSAGEYSVYVVIDDEIVSISLKILTIY